MKFICHRGNILGPNSELENNPDYIRAALKTGSDVEVDVWLTDDGFFLGHDKPKYPVSHEFFRNQKIWTHCKNSSAYLALVPYQDINCFLQESEEYVMTSRGYLWAHSRAGAFNNKTVAVDLNFTSSANTGGAFAICTDFVDTDIFVKSKLPFDLLIIDIDGVMTDGTKIYDRDGSVSGKAYCDLDFTAIKRFKAAGINVCFLSGDRAVNENMAKSRKIEFFHNKPGVDKANMLNTIKTYYKASTVAYIGDDYYDIGIMNFVDLPFCPKNVPASVLRAAKILPIKAGAGVVAGLYDLFEDQIPYAFPTDSADVNPI